jgi:queuosine precursor transporter
VTLSNRPHLDVSGKRNLLYLVLAGFFVSNALLGEILGGKLIAVGPFTMSMGVVVWPVVFLTTDVINEYFGKPGVRRLTLLTVGLILYAFVVIFAAMQIPAARISPVSDQAFRMVFGQSLWIIVGSVTAFLISQLVDVVVFWLFRDRTGGRHLWLRATGSTAVSQLIDTFVILAIAFWLPGKISTRDFLGLSLLNYSYKLGIAVALTPLIYAAHRAIDNFLGERESIRLQKEAVVKSHAEA